MSEAKILSFIKNVLDNMPSGWLNKTTHRLDIYNEEQAKFDFLAQVEALYIDNNTGRVALENLSTAYDYIRLGHPLSCLLEWVVGGLYDIDSKNVISFSSRTMPVFSVLRKNLIDNVKTRIVYEESLPEFLDMDLIKDAYGYNFELERIQSLDEISVFDGSTIFISQDNEFCKFSFSPHIDFFISSHSKFGSLCVVHGKKNENYISEIQHVRRRETVAMTPAHCLSVLKRLINGAMPEDDLDGLVEKKVLVEEAIKEITGATSSVLLGSCGLSVQYAIMMGLVQEAQKRHKGKKIKFIVPPNCYGGTNDQARRVAACIDNVEVVDLPVDGENNMVQSTEIILESIAAEGGVPYIIAEIPTNPRVEVPELLELKEVLSKSRHCRNGKAAIDPVFILDQTFCPNVRFLGEGDVFSSIHTISYVSGSKFPSGGLCTAGYCVSSQKSENMMESIASHLKLCDNEATDQQVETLSMQLPSMNQRISEAYKNTREFVSYIAETLPEAKINFVSQELAEAGFTPSVFSLDLPSRGDSDEKRESYKRELNYKLINLMIKRIPDEALHCVSYGQLKGSYWTIPATSSQGTTKEGDKDYIVRVALAPDMDVDLHKQVFQEFVNSEKVL